MIAYLSYDSEDAQHGKRLKSVLQPLTRHMGFTVWSQQDTRPGARWQEEMAAHLRDAMLFIPLVSADFLVSKHCNAELTAAVRLEQMGQLKIIPVLLRPCFLDFPPLNTMPSLPRNGKPVASWKSQDEAWLDVQQDIIKAVKGLQIS